MQGLNGKVALVTGASRGDGKGIALELAAAGATVYFTGRSVEEMHYIPGKAWLGNMALQILTEKRRSRSRPAMYKRRR